MDVGRHIQADGAFGRMKDKVGVIHHCDFGVVLYLRLQTFPSNISPVFLTSQVDDLQEQLEKEVSRRSQLEKVNGDLKDQLASLKSSNRSNDQLERSKRQLEEEVLDLRRRMEASQMEQSQVEHFRRDAEDRARQEIQQKLEQVNIFLQVRTPLNKFINVSVSLITYDCVCLSPSPRRHPKKRWIRLKRPMKPTCAPSWSRRSGRWRENWAGPAPLSRTASTKETPRARSWSDTASSTQRSCASANPSLPN